MPKENIAQTSWKYGEVSPLLRGRIDTEAWRNGAETLENFIVTPQGGLLRRPGTKSITHSVTGTDVRLLQFKGTDGVAYVLQLTNGAGLAVYKNELPVYGPNGQRIENAFNSGGAIRLTIQDHNLDDLGFYSVQDVGGIAAATGYWQVTVIDSNTIELNGSAFAGTYTGGGIIYGGLRIIGATFGAGEVTVTTSIAHGYSSGFTVGIDGVGGFTGINGQWTVASTPTTTTFNFAYSGTVAAYTSGGSVSSGEMIIPSITQSTTDYYKYQIAQSGDVLFLAHPLYQTITISKFGERKWEVRKFEQSDGPYLDRNNTYIRLKITGYSDSATFEDTGATVNFLAGDVGKYLQYREDNQWKLALITARTSATKVTADIKSNLILNVDQTVKLRPKVSATSGTVGMVAQSPENESYSKNQRYENRTLDTKAKRDLYETRRQKRLLRQGIDPQAAISVASTTISSTHAGTFSNYDVGCFVKTTAGVASNPSTWYQVSAFGTPTSVTASLVTRISGKSETNERSIVYYNRSITATVTASAPDGVSPSIFTSTDVGRHIRFHFTGIVAWGKITAYTSATQVTVKFYEDLPLDPSDKTRISNDGIVEDWQLGAWSDSTGWPASVAIHEQRLCFGGNTAQPQTVWMSISGDYWNFSPTEPDGSVLDDSAITYTIASEKVSPIAWMVSAKVLMIGTLGAEWQARSSTSVMEPITPTNISVTPQSTFGSARFQSPQRVGNSIYYIQRGGFVLRKMSYDYNTDGFKSDDVSIASEHVLRRGGGASFLASTTTPFSVIWIVLADGTLASVTVNEDESQYSWCHHTLGLYQSCSVYGASTIDSNSNGNEQLYLVVERSSPSELEIERLSDLWVPSGSSTRASLSVPFTDASTAQTLTSATTCPAGGYIPNGATVQAVINGTTYVTGTISGGTLALGGTYTGTCYIGYGYTSQLKMLPPEGGSAFGTAMSKTKRVNRVGIRHFSSYKFKHGPSTSSLISRTIPGTTTNFFTGDDKFELNSPYDLEAGYVVQVDEPWPIGILAVAPELKTNE